MLRTRQMSGDSTHAERFWSLMRNTERTGVVLRRLLLSSLTRQLVDGNERIAGLTR